MRVIFHSASDSKDNVNIVTYHTFACLHDMAMLLPALATAGNVIVFGQVIVIRSTQIAVRILRQSFLMVESRHLCYITQMAMQTDSAGSEGHIWYAGRQ